LTETSGGPEPPDNGPDGGQPRRPLGLTAFTLEGRAAPALFLVGWLATLIGLGATVVATGASGLAGVILFAAGTALLTVGLIAAGGSQAIERRAAGVTTYAGPSPVLVFAASVSSTLFLSAVLGSVLIRLGLDPDAPALTLVGSLIIFGSYFALVRFLVVGTGSLSWREMGFRASRKGFLEDAAWGLALAVPVLAVTGIVAVFLSTFLPLPNPVLPPATDPAGIALNLAVAALIAPIGEELFFRGFATTAWARLSGPRRALVQGAVFFALAHILTLGAGDLVEGIKLALFASLVRLPIALALGWLFLQRRSLVAPIFLHAAYNGLPIIALAAGLGNPAGS
jgi:membrane protease YdiL (CAAX protease family)